MMLSIDIYLPSYYWSGHFHLFTNRLDFTSNNRGRHLHFLIDCVLLKTQVLVFELLIVCSKIHK